MKMKLKQSPIFCLIVLFPIGSFALELGSERFTTFTQGAPDYGVMVGLARDPQVNSNVFFTDRNFVNGIAGHPFPEGATHKYFVANMMNFEANYTMAGAKTDPRTPGFIMNSMDGLVSDPQSEIELTEGITASKLSAAQAGENSARYIVPEIITPEVGYYQTTDNQQSFESAYDNVMLGKAEEALFQGDEAQAISYFDSKVAEFKENSDKQSSAGSFQKDGIMRSKKTAETFRDFFEMKASVSAQNLGKMPTKGSLVQNCQKNSHQGMNNLAVYQKSMPPAEIQFYNFAPPSYPFNFCEQYVHTEENFLIRNLPVHDQLETLVDDSTEMASGLNEISEQLSDQSLSVEQIAAILSTNEAWKTLSKRSRAYKECAKNDCLGSAAKAFKKMVDYPGASRQQSPLRQQLRATLKGIIQSKRMPGSSSKGSSSSSQLANLLNKEMKKLKKSRFKNELTNKAAGNGLISEAEKANSRNRSPASIGRGNRPAYNGKRFPRGGGYFRGEAGVLRGPSGLPVQGYANSVDSDLFKIISRRYMIKFNPNLDLNP